MLFKSLLVMNGAKVQEEKKPTAFSLSLPLFDVIAKFGLICK